MTENNASEFTLKIDDSIRDDLLGTKGSFGSVVNSFTSVQSLNPATFFEDTRTRYVVFSDSGPSRYVAPSAMEKSFTHDLDQEDLSLKFSFCINSNR